LHSVALVIICLVLQYNSAVKPLLSDGFFVAMAVTIMFGLGFATVLTLIVVPVLYATFFKIPYRESKA
jgi:multidrug efflux pump subunit AcrB